MSKEESAGRRVRGILIVADEPDAHGNVFTESCLRDIAAQGVELTYDEASKTLQFSRETIEHTGAVLGFGAEATSPRDEDAGSSD